MTTRSLFQAFKPKKALSPRSQSLSRPRQLSLSKRKAARLAAPQETLLQKRTMKMAQMKMKKRRRRSPPSTTIKRAKTAARVRKPGKEEQVPEVRMPRAG